MYNIINNQINPKILLILILTILSVSCDVIPDGNRIVEMETVVPQKKVLLLDFTDQACPNCPKAGIEIDKMKEEYGENLVSVTIHASALPRPLVTADGNKYEEHFGTKETGHPAGVIDGKLVGSVYENWAGIVLSQFNLKPSAHITLSAEIQENTLKIETALETDLQLQNPKLLLWVVEDSVIAKQLWGIETIDNYLHRRIFRTAVNSTWGEEIIFNQSNKSIKNYTFALNNAWNKAHLSVVAFVYNAVTDEVYDVNETKLN